MKKIILALIGSLLASAATACGNDANQVFMADFLYADADYQQYICGTEACEKAQFQEALEYRAELLNKKGSLQGCFVEPKNKARNFYTGFFVIQTGKLMPQFVFFGSGLGVSKNKYKKFKTVIGQEIVEPGETALYEFNWNGKAYVETSNKNIKW